MPAVKKTNHLMIESLLNGGFNFIFQHSPTPELREYHLKILTTIDRFESLRSILKGINVCENPFFNRDKREFLYGEYVSGYTLGRVNPEDLVNPYASPSIILRDGDLPATFVSLIVILEDWQVQKKDNHESISNIEV